MSKPEKQKIGSAADFIRKGGTLLSETCIKCGGLQIRYKERTFCLTCGDFSDLSRVEAQSPSDVLTSLKDLALGKMLETSNLLKVESDIEKQSNLVSLILKYVELLDKVTKPSEKKTETKT